ncbi:MAG: hypothetical protein RL095_1994 [Verrucomicrobiota bacterium]|jgi:hypothetical protein
MIDEEQQRLIEAFVDDSLDEAGLDRLVQALQASPACRRELELAMRLRGLGALAESATSAQGFAASVLDRCAGLQTASLESKVLKSLQHRAQKASASSRRPALWRHPLLAAAIAAQILIGLGLWLIFSKPEALVIGQVVSAAEDGFLVRKQEKICLHPGLEIRAGDLLQLGRLDGCEIGYRDGTRLRLLPEASARLQEEDGAKRLHLFDGSLYLEVTPQPTERAFEIRSAHAVCTVRGTRLHLTATAIFTRLDVEHGAVEMSSLLHPGALLVKAGESASASASAAARSNSKTDPIFSSGLVTKGTVPISVALKGARKIYLVVDTGGDRGTCDHAVWIHPRLRGPGRPELSLNKRPWLLARSAWAGPLPHLDSGLFGDVATVQGRPVRPCISVHADSVIAYEVPAGYDCFEAEGGVLDSGFSPPAYFPSVRFHLHTEISPEQLKRLMP